MDKVGGKKAISCKKKINGGEPMFKLNHNLNKYRDFVVKEIENNGTIKNKILKEINNYIRLKNTSNDYDYNLFYIYDEKDIISIGVIDKNPYINNNSGQIYHILSLLSEKYAGIFLHSTESAKSFYKCLGFIEHDGLFILDKTRENILILEAKLPHPITTEFHSTYPI